MRLVELDQRDFALAEPERSLDGLEKTRASFRADSCAILHDGDERGKTFFRWRLVGAHDFSAKKNADITLLLQELEKVARLGFWRHGDAESHEHRSPRKADECLIHNRPRRFG